MTDNKDYTILSEMLLEKVSGGTYDPSGDQRNPQRLYYRKNVVDTNKTARELAAMYPELSDFMMQLKLFGYDNQPLSVLIGKYGMASVQNLIDSYTA